MSFYAALGDSMSIDDYAGGPGHGAASLLYRNNDADFPDWAGRDLARRQDGLSAVFLARDGATSSDVLGSQLGALEARAEAPTIATITMGGNDVLATYGNTTAARRAIADVRANGAQILTRLRRLMGDSTPIVLSTVYDPSDGSGELVGVLPPWPEALAVLSELNAAIADLASEFGCLLADVHRAFLGHGSRAGDPGQAEPRPTTPELWYCGVVEPNAWGASAIRAAWWAALC